MNIGSKLFVLAISCLFFASIGGAFSTTDTSKKPKTKLEAFHQQTGSVLIKGYSEIGSVVAIEPSPASLSVRAMEFTSANKRKFSLY